jgi:pyocin large subunit-like protein
LTSACRQDRLRAYTIVRRRTRPRPRRAGRRARRRHHWRNDFDATTKEDYARRASEFFERGVGDGIEGKIDLAENKIRMYEASTNTFGSYTLNGEPITFYRPNPLVHPFETNAEYWRAQPGTRMPPPEVPPIP